MPNSGFAEPRGVFGFPVTKHSYHQACKLIFATPADCLKYRLKYPQSNVLEANLGDNRMDLYSTSVRDVSEPYPHTAHFCNSP
jgi:hypothetical protein